MYCRCDNNNTVQTFLHVLVYTFVYIFQQYLQETNSFIGDIFRAM